MEFNLGCLYTLGCLVYYWSMVDFPKDTPLKKTDPSFSCSYQMPIVPHWERKLDAHPVSMILGSVAPVFFPPTIILWAFTPHGFQTQFLVQSNIPNSLNSSPIVQYSDISQFLASIDNVIENIAFLAILKLLFFFHYKWWVYATVLCMHQPLYSQHGSDLLSTVSFLRDPERVHDLPASTYLLKMWNSFIFHFLHPFFSKTTLPS